MLHLRGSPWTTGLRLEHRLKLRVCDRGRGYFRVNPTGRDMGINERLDLFRHAQKIQHWVPIEIRRHFINEPEQLGIAKHSTGNLRTMLENVKNVVEATELVDELCSGFEVCQQIHTFSDLLLQVC